MFLVDQMLQAIELAPGRSPQFPKTYDKKRQVTNLPFYVLQLLN